MRPQWSSIVQLAAFVGKYAYDMIVTMFQMEYQPTVNDLSTSILDNLTGMERR